MVGTPFAINLAQYGYLVLAVGLNVVMLTLSFLRCIDRKSRKIYSRRAVSHPVLTARSCAPLRTVKWRP
jgi:hypothetical protein